MVFAVVDFDGVPVVEDVVIEISNWSLSTCSPATDPIVAPTAPMVVDDSCPDGMNITPGSIDYAATTCPAGTNIEYSLLDVRCLCDSGLASELASVATNPEVCPPPGCVASASTISTTDPTRICIDGVGDPINVDFDVTGMGAGAWVIRFRWCRCRSMFDLVCQF